MERFIRLIGQKWKVKYLIFHQKCPSSWAHNCVNLQLFEKVCQNSLIFYKMYQNPIYAVSFEKLGVYEL